jgi:hypothetical protein
MVLAGACPQDAADQFYYALARKQGALIALQKDTL